MFRYTISSLVKADVMDEMPFSPNQQGMGFGIYLDNQFPTDNESLITIERSYPIPTGIKSLRIKKPGDKPIIAFEDLLNASKDFEKLIKLIINESQFFDSAIEDDIMMQFKKFPRVNWSL